MKGSKNRIAAHLLTVIVLLTLLALIAGCGRSEAEVIKIGAILPLTGDGAKYGQSARRGIDLAVSEINESGGIEGKLIEILYEDSKLDPRAGTDAIHRLLSIEKVPAVIGAMGSSVTLAIAPIAEDHKVVLLSPTSSAPAITNAGDYVFRNTYSDIFEGVKMGTYAFNQLSFRRVAIFHLDNDFGVGLSNTFSRRFAELGGQVVITESYEAGALHFRTQLAKIRNVNPDGVYVVGYSEMGRVLRQAREMGITLPVISCIMFEDPTIVQVASGAAEGVVYTYPAYNAGSDKETVSLFVEEFEETFNQKPDIYAASAFDALRILAQAMKESGFTSDSIKGALYSIQDYPGVTGTTTFDRNGDVSKPIGIKKVENGDFVWVVQEFE